MFREVERKGKEKILAALHFLQPNHKNGNRSFEAEARDKEISTATVSKKSQQAVNENVQQTAPAADSESAVDGAQENVSATTSSHNTMSKRQSRLQHLKKAAVGSTMAVSLLMGSLFQPLDEDELLAKHPERLQSQSAIVSVLEEPVLPAEVDEEKKRKKQGVMARIGIWFQRAPLPVRLLFLAPIWALGKLASVALTGMATAAGGPVLGAIAAAALNTAVLGTTVVAAQKLANPKRSLKQIFSKKNALSILLCVVALTATDSLLTLFCPEQYHSVRAALVLVLCCAAVALLLHWGRPKQANDSPKEKDRADEKQADVVSTSGSTV